MQRFVSLAVIAAAAVLAGCSSQSTKEFLDRITPYKVEIVQGNVVTKEQAALVKPGMTRTQVRDALGSPLLTDVFHADRWDYVFTIRRKGTEPQERRVVVLFDGDKVKSIDAPELPSEQEFDASITRRSDQAKGEPPALGLTDAQKAALPPLRVPEAAASAAEPQGAARTYPPLEPQ